MSNSCCEPKATCQQAFLANDGMKQNYGTSPHCDRDHHCVANVLATTALQEMQIKISGKRSKENASIFDMLRIHRNDVGK